jgi:hypothetical protein
MLSTASLLGFFPLLIARAKPAVGGRVARRSAALLLTLCVIGTGASSEMLDEELDELREPNWIPSLNVGVESFDYEADAETVNLIDPPRWSVSGGDPQRQLLVTIGGELMGPALEAIPGRPRLFLGGGVGITFGAATIVNIGQPDGDARLDQDKDTYLNTTLHKELNAPNPSRNCVSTPPCKEPSIDKWGGQGSEILASFDDFTWFANLGVSFDIPVFQSSLIQLRPSAAYRGEKVDLDGLLTVVVDEGFDPNTDWSWVDDPDDPPNQIRKADGSKLPVFRSRGAGREGVSQHHLGPRLELAFVLSRTARPVRTTLFVEGSYLWLLSDRSQSFRDPDGIAAYSVHRDRSGFRGGGGVRFSWVGFGGD